MLEEFWPRMAGRLCFEPGEEKTGVRVPRWELEERRWGEVAVLEGEMSLESLKVTLGSALLRSETRWRMESTLSVRLEVAER